MPVLVPSTREDAPIRKVQNLLLPNNFPSNKWPLYDVCLISDMPISMDVKHALTLTMNIVDIIFASDIEDSSMAIVASSIEGIGTPIIELSFIGRLIKDYNANKSIDEVQVEIEGQICKITRIRYKGIGWLRSDYSNSKLAENDLKIFPHHNTNTNTDGSRRIPKRP